MRSHEQVYAVGDWLIHIHYGIGQVFFGYRLRRRQKMIVSAPSFSKIAWYLNGLPVWKSLHSPAVSS